MQSCLVCGADTLVIVSIDFRTRPVCDRCCLLITKQTVAAITNVGLSADNDPETVQTCFGEFIVGGEG